jgi:ATP-dependent Clp protease protease subunit
MEIHAREIIKIREQINSILVECTGQDMERIKTDTERDFFMSAEEARDYGVIDEIITPSKLALAAEAAG